MMKPICLVMILTLVFSLIEALLILPSHLAALPVQLPDGQHTPLGTLAKVTLTPGVAKLIRQDRRRAS